MSIRLLFIPHDRPIRRAIALDENAQAESSRTCLRIAATFRIAYMTQGPPKTKLARHPPVIGRIGDHRRFRMKPAFTTEPTRVDSWRSNHVYRMERQTAGPRHFRSKRDFFFSFVFACPFSDGTCPLIAILGRECGRRPATQVNGCTNLVRGPAAQLTHAGDPHPPWQSLPTDAGGSCSGYDREKSPRHLSA